MTSAPSAISAMCRSRVPIRSPTRIGTQEIGDRQAALLERQAVQTRAGGDHRATAPRMWRGAGPGRTPGALRPGESTTGSGPLRLFVLDRARRSRAGSRDVPDTRPRAIETPTPSDDRDADRRPRHVEDQRPAAGEQDEDRPRRPGRSRSRAADPTMPEDPGLDDDGPADLAAGHPGRAQDAELADALEDADRQGVDDARAPPR